MSRADAIARARQQLHSGEFLAELDRRVAYQTESQNPERRDALRPISNKNSCRHFRNSTSRQD
jgi:hypothetical protein